MINAQSIIIDEGAEIIVTPGTDICASAWGNIYGNVTGSGTQCGGVLPVQMISLNAVVENFRDVKISWVTALEINNKGFEVERNLNGSVWKKVGWITGNGNITNQSVYSFIDKKLDIGAYYYRLKQIDYNGNFEYFQVNETIQVNSPGLFSISQNYPNPSNPVSTIEYQIPENSKVILHLYDVKGSMVKELVNQDQESGYYSIKLDGSNLASGIYFYTIIVQAARVSYTETKKMLLIK